MNVGHGCVGMKIPFSLLKYAEILLRNLIAMELVKISRNKKYTIFFKR